MKRLLITGIGMVSPIGIGTEAIWAAVKSGSGGIRKLSRVSFREDIRCGEVRDFVFGEYIDDRRFRRAAPISQYALAATAVALGDAGCAGADMADAALVMGITHGALGYTQYFHRDLVEGGPEAVSPIYFSDSVLNAPAGNASICFGIRGPVHTILGGPEAAVKSMMTACRMIREGETGRAAVVAAEELNELSLSCYTRLGHSPLSEGAGALVIEIEGRDAQSSSYCCIAGMASECNPSDPDAALENSLNLCMDRAGLKISDIDLAMSDSKIPSETILKAVPTATLTHLTGNAFAAGKLWEVALSAMAVRKGLIPQTVINSCCMPSRMNNVLVCTADEQGSASAILLSGV